MPACWFTQDFSLRRAPFRGSFSSERYGGRCHRRTPRRTYSLAEGIPNCTYTWIAGERLSTEDVKRIVWGASSSAQSLHFGSAFDSCLRNIGAQTARRWMGIELNGGLLAMARASQMLLPSYCIRRRAAREVSVSPCQAEGQLLIFLAQNNLKRPKSSFSGFRLCCFIYSLAQRGCAQHTTRGATAHF